MKLSVIICTHNRSHAIIPCLESVSAALNKAPPVKAEIIIVNNASTDNTANFVREWSTKCEFPVRLVDEPQKGLSKARNRGLQEAKGELLIFTDDDCHMEGNYILDALRYNAEDKEPVLRGGRVELGDPTDLPLTVKTVNERKRWDPKDKIARHVNLGDTILGCNMVFPHVLAEKIGSFDTVFGAGTKIHGAEDTDYIYRAYLAGFVIEYVPDMMVRHFHGRKTKEQGEKLIRGYCIGGGALYAKYILRHPIMCMQFYWDVRNLFKNLFSKDKTFMSEIYFTLKDKVIYNLQGMLIYYSESIKNCILPKAHKS